MLFFAAIIAMASVSSCETSVFSDVKESKYSSIDTVSVDSSSCGLIDSIVVDTTVETVVDTIKIG